MEKATRKRAARVSPLLAFDRLRVAGCSGVVGVDEVGRGAFAGPVVAAAVYLPAEVFEVFKRKDCEGSGDSMALSAQQREATFAVIGGWAASGAKVAIGEGSVVEIEQHNILGATTLAMRRALEALGIALRPDIAGDDLFSESEDIPGPALLIDGKPIRNFPYAHEAVVKGDACSLSIAAASIVAKVKRDRLMGELAREFAAYCWESNKGYGSCARHRQAILEHGPTPHHRSAFLRNLLREPPPVEKQLL